MSQVAMSEAMRLWHDTLLDEIESVRSLVSSIDHISDTFEKNMVLDKAEKKLLAANNTKRAFKQEMRIEPDTTKKKMYEGLFQQHEQNLSKLSSEIKVHRAGASRDQLFLGANGGAGANGNLNLDPETPEDAVKTGDAMLNDASRIQDKTQDALSRTQANVNETKVIGMQTMETLRGQRDQLSNINSELDRVDDSLKRADLLIKTFGKRMATDKIIQCFACTNILLLVGVIIYAIVKRQGLTGEDQAPPDPTGESQTQTTRMLRSLIGSED